MAMISLRVDEHKRELWVEAAGANQQTLTAWLTEAADRALSEGGAGAAPPSAITVAEPSGAPPVTPPSESFRPDFGNKLGNPKK